MFCSKCGHQNPDNSKFCQGCGAPLSGTGNGGGEGSLAGQGGSADKKYNILLKVFASIFAVLYLIKALRVLLAIYSNIVLALGMDGWAPPMALRMRGIFNLLLIFLVFVSCVVLAAMLICLALNRRKKNAEPLYLGVVSAIVLRIAVAALSMLVSMLFNFFMSVHYSYWLLQDLVDLGKSIFYAAVTAGSLYGILWLSGIKPFVGKNINQFKAMFKELAVILKNEPEEIIDMAKGIKKDIQDKQASAASARDASAGRNDFAGGAVPGGGMAGAAPGGGFAGGGMAGAAPGGGFAGGDMAGAAAGGSVSGIPGQGGPMKTDRNLAVIIGLSIVTCGIYGIYYYHVMSQDINVLCAGDGQETMDGALAMLLGAVTCGIYTYVWYYQFANRLQANAPRYGLAFSESGATIFLWMFFGAWLCLIGPFVALYLMLKNLNELSKAYNAQMARPMA